MKGDLTTLQLAARWSMHPGTLRNWRAQGRGPRFVTIGENGRNRKPRIVYRLADVQHYEKRFR